MINRWGLAMPSALSQPLIRQAGDWILIARDSTGVLYNKASHALFCVDQPPDEPNAGLEELFDRDAMRRHDADTTKTHPVERPVTPAFAPLLNMRRSTLGRLTINIANACNLWCSYCYADHGQYHAPSSLMQPDTAVAIVTKCLGLYDNIRLIQFFGGEPLLNIEAIEAVCQYLNSRGDAIPRFVATTNGTLLND